MLKLLILAALAATASAHESCCAKKARLAKLRTIPDPNAEPPAVDASDAHRRTDQVVPRRQGVGDVEVVAAPPDVALGESA